MSQQIHDLTRSLLAILEEQAQQLEQLLAAMRENRSAFVSARPSHLDGAIAQLEQEAESARDLDQQRVSCAHELALALDLPGAVSLKDILERLDAGARQRFAPITAWIRDAARGIEIEKRLGTRLLENSNQAQEELLLGLLGQEQGRVSTYGEDAQASEENKSKGRLISGLI